MQEMAPGAMLSVRLSEDEVRPFLNKDLCLAVVNAPSQCVIAGPAEAIDDLEEKVSARKLDCTRLHTSHAFHSEMMRPVLAPFTELVRGVKRNPPSIPFVSNVTGTWITAEQAMDPEYWATHLAQTVRFADGVQALKETGAVLLEVGPGQTLSTLARQQLHGPQAQPAISTLRRAAETTADQDFLLTALGHLWLAGVKIDWQEFYANERRSRLPLPSYPFERERYWIEAGVPAKTANARRAPSGKLPDLADWFYTPLWKQSPARLSSVEENKDPICWLIFADEHGLGSLIAEQLEQKGHEVIMVRAAEQFTQLDERTFAVNPAASKDYESLLKELQASKRVPQQVLHLWNATPVDCSEAGNQSFAAVQGQGFYSLLFLARALEKSSITNSLQINLVTANTQEVSGGEKVSPARSTVLAACTVIPQEYPNIKCRSIDVDSDNSRGMVRERLANRLISELTGSATDLVVAYRGAQRWIRSFEAVRLTETAPVRLRPQGAYLIVGSGKVASTLAEYLRRTVQARIVRPEEVNLSEVNLGEVDGVFYTAAIDAEEPRLTIGEASRAEIDQRFQNTLQPLFTLEEALRDQKLDFCILMSSLSAVLGGPGLLSASAQGIFLDAFAARQNQIQSVPWISIDWDVWQFEEDKSPELGITPVEAMEVLGRVMGHSFVSPVAVSTGDLQSRIARWLNLESANTKQEANTAASSSGHARPNLPNSFVAPRNELESTVVNIWQSLLGIKGIGVEDNLFDLGGDSLLAIQIISRIREVLHTEIALRSIFEMPTVAGVVGSIQQHQQSMDAQMETIDEVIDLVEQLSEEELRLLIAEQEGLTSKAGGVC